MNKNEIIQSLVNATIPDGSKLVEREVGHGVRISSVGDNPGGMAIAMSRILHTSLNMSTAGWGDVPDAELLKRLHTASITYFEEAIGALTIPKLGDGLVNDHRKVVGRLREISAQLGISYEEPADHLL
ncbi:MAG: hypothetical protein Q7S86_01355 [bacterium]|nr:hypothetical protein [bacterium]